jgi:hypothetical protein
MTATGRSWTTSNVPLSSLPRLGNLYVLGRASNLGGLRGEKLTHVAAERRDRCASLSGLDGQ